MLEKNLKPTHKCVYRIQTTTTTTTKTKLKHETACVAMNLSFVCWSQQQQQQHQKHIIIIIINDVGNLSFFQLCFKYMQVNEELERKKRERNGSPVFDSWQH